jgi:hypothetical protein
MNAHNAVGRIGVDGGDVPLDGKTPANSIECVE